jgi:hypothetical protein
MSSNPVQGSQHSGDALASRLKRTELQRSVSSILGCEIVQVLTEIPAGVLSTYIVEVGQPLATFTT